MVRFQLARSVTQGISRPHRTGNYHWTIADRYQVNDVPPHRSINVPLKESKGSRHYIDQGAGMFELYTERASWRQRE